MVQIYVTKLSLTIKAVALKLTVDVDITIFMLKSMSRLLIQPYRIKACSSVMNFSHGGAILFYVIWNEYSSVYIRQAREMGILL